MSKHPTESWFDSLAGRQRLRPHPHDSSQTVDLTGAGTDSHPALQDGGSPGSTLTAPVVLDGLACHYKIEDRVGVGGMGEVFACADKRFGRETVAKILHLSLVERQAVKRRFFEEIRITSRLEHPGVVPVYDVGVLADGRPFFVMQRVWGLTLRQLLDERTSPLDGVTRLLKVYEQVCTAVAYAHSARVIHRDLNPANVMAGLFGQVKVMDWGLGKFLDEQSASAEVEFSGTNELPATDAGVESHTQLGSVMGTPAYMPPEQAGGDISLVDERCDVFGLGAILCEILTGAPPYAGGSTAVLLRRARTADLSDAFARLDACRADPELVALAKSCLARNLAERPRDAGVVVDRLNYFFEAVLRQAEWDMIRFFDLSLDLFCIAGFDGYFHRVNDNFARVLGYTKDDLLSQPFLKFVHPDDVDRSVSEVTRLSLGQPVVRFRNRYRKSCGDYRWFEWMAKSIPKEGVIFAVARDVTEHVELEDQLNRLRNGNGTA